MCLFFSFLLSSLSDIYPLFFHKNLWKKIGPDFPLGAHFIFNVDSFFFFCGWKSVKNFSLHIFSFPSYVLTLSFHLHTWREKLSYSERAFIFHPKSHTKIYLLRPPKGFCRLGVINQLDFHLVLLLWQVLFFLPNVYSLFEK